MSNATAVTTFQIRTYSDHGFTQTEVTISSADAVKVQDRIDGCIDNKDGYRNAAIAAEQERKFRAIADAGHTHVYSTHTYGLRLTLRWQHYTNPQGEADGYCDPHFEDLGRDFSGVEKGVKLLRKLGTRIEKMRAATSGSDMRPVSNWTFSTPERVIEALRTMKFVEIAFDRGLDEILMVLPATATSEAA